MSERTQRRLVVRGLRHLDAMAVENPCLPGTPDVNYVEGWIELKWLRRWPRDAETVVRLDHFTQVQRLWLRRRWQRGGNAFLLLQVGREWLLFDGAAAAQSVGLLSRSGLHEASLLHWTQGLNFKELTKWLTEPRTMISSHSRAESAC